jgi:hypothetical protein
MKPLTLFEKQIVFTLNFLMDIFCNGVDLFFGRVPFPEDLTEAIRRTISDERCKVKLAARLRKLGYSVSPDDASFAKDVAAFILAIVECAGGLEFVTRAFRFSAEGNEQAFEMLTDYAQHPGLMRSMLQSVGRSDKNYRWLKCAVLRDIAGLLAVGTPWVE